MSTEPTGFAGTFDPPITAAGITFLGWCVSTDDGTEFEDEAYEHV